MVRAKAARGYGPPFALFCKKRTIALRKEVITIKPPQISTPVVGHLVKKPKFKVLFVGYEGTECIHAREQFGSDVQTLKHSEIGKIKEFEAEVLVIEASHRFDYLESPKTLEDTEVSMKKFQKLKRYYRSDYCPMLASGAVKTVMILCDSRNIDIQVYVIVLSIKEKVEDCRVDSVDMFPSSSVLSRDFPRNYPHIVAQVKARMKSSAGWQLP